MAERVLLVGLMGVGKSAVGEALARRTGWPYTDNDELLIRATGQDAQEIGARGEDALRDAESAALGEALSSPAPVVAAIAAGVVTREADRRRLREGGFVVWLRASSKVLAERVMSDDQRRPWLEQDAEGVLSRLAAERNSLYAEVADLVLDTGQTSPQDCAQRILVALPEPG